MPGKRRPEVFHKLSFGNKRLLEHVEHVGEVCSQNVGTETRARLEELRKRGFLKTRIVPSWSGWKPSQVLYLPSEGLWIG